MSFTSWYFKILTIRFDDLLKIFCCYDRSKVGQVVNLLDQIVELLSVRSFLGYF